MLCLLVVAFHNNSQVQSISCWQCGMYLLVLTYQLWKSDACWDDQLLWYQFIQQAEYCCEWRVDKRALVLSVTAIRNVDPGTDQPG